MEGGVMWSRESCCMCHRHQSQRAWLDDSDSECLHLCDASFQLIKVSKVYVQGSKVLIVEHAEPNLTCLKFVKIKIKKAGTIGQVDYTPLSLIVWTVILKADYGKRYRRYARIGLIEIHDNDTMCKTYLLHTELCAQFYLAQRAMWYDRF